jgi:DNA-binding phage protein
MPKLTVKTEPYRESLVESLSNPDEAAQYLNACLEDEDTQVFLLALRDIAEAHGGIRALSRTTHLKGEPLSHALQVRQSIPGQSGIGPVCMRLAPRGSVNSAAAA